jgi:hypothetical protein
VSKTSLVVLGCVSIAFGLTAGCAFQQEKVEQQLARPAPINCATADGDMRVLRSEKADVAQRIVEGVTAVYPADAVMGMVTGTETTKLKVAVGEYDRAIDARIAEIQRTLDPGTRVGRHRRLQRRSSHSMRPSAQA